MECKSWVRALLMGLCMKGMEVKHQSHKAHDGFLIDVALPLGSREYVSHWK